MKKFLIALVALLPFVAKAQNKLIGIVPWPAAKVGLYDIDPVKGSLNRRIMDTDMFLIQTGAAYGMGGLRRDDFYYVTNYYTDDRTIRVLHAVYDLNTNKRVWMKSGGMVASAPLDMTFCEADGKAYGCFWSMEGLGEAYVFGTLNLEDFTVTQICYVYEKWLAIAAAPDGSLYAVNDSGQLLRVNKATGETTVIAKTDAPVYFEASAVITPDGKQMLLGLCDMEGDNYLYTLNLSDGSTASVKTFAGGEETIGLDYLEAEVDGAPQAAPRLEVPLCASTVATLSFDMPEGDGTQTAIISMDGKEVRRQTFAAGSSATVSIDAETVAYHTFSLRVAEGGKVSLPRSARLWVGTDSPHAPLGVTLSREGDTHTLSWEAVTEGVHGGWLDASNVTYDIYRYPGGTLVASALAATTWSETVPEPDALTTMYYTVEAVMATGERSLKSESNHLTLATIKPPYSETFDDDAVVDNFTIIDANGDDVKWEWYDYGKMRVFGSDEVDMDDWLITPPVTLEAGKYYEFSLTLHGFKRAYPEFFEICVGRDATAAGMTTTLLPRTQLSIDTDSKYAVGYLAPADGVCYFGLHGVSPAGTQYIYADNMAISEAMAPAMPAQVSDLTLTRAPQGRPAVDVAFTLPTTTVAGEPLSSLTKCVVTRDGYTTLKTLENVTPGQRIEFTDELLMAAFRRYSVVVYNEAGASAPAEALEYVGPYAPAEPTAFVVERTENDGEVLMTWQAPAVDKNGEPLDPSLVTYTVAALVDGNVAYVADKYTGTSFTYQAQAAGKPQSFVSYALYAVTDGGSSSKVESVPCAVGAPYQMPFVESFTAGGFQNAWFVDDVFGVSSWGAYTDNQLLMSSADGDNGFVYATTAVSGNLSTLNSGLMTIAEGKVIVEMQVWSNGAADKAETTVNMLVDGEVREVGVVAHAASAEGWQKVSLPIEGLAGRDAQLQLLARFGTQRFVAYDNIRVTIDAANNLSLAEVEIPASVQAGQQFTVKATIQNNGMADVAGTTFRTVLLCDGAEVNSKKGFGTLRTGKTTTATFNESLSVMDEGEHTYQVKVEYSIDDAPDDNASEVFTVDCVVPDYPTPSSAALVLNGDEQQLTWQAPVEPDELPVTTEDFESYPLWEMRDLAPWTLVDKDDSYAGTIGIIPIPGIVENSTRFAYMTVSDDVENGGFSQLTAHSGHQSLLAIYSRYTQNDDWLISPALSGHAQTIRFWARSGSPSYPETFAVMVTSAYSVNPDDYTDHVEYVEAAPKAWTEYVMDLPEGTTHFAIRCMSYDAYYFLVDDITYTADTYSTTDLIGYNIYKDGARVNESPVEVLTLPTDDRISTYHVTAVYHKGESRPVKVEKTIDAITLTPATAPATTIHDISGRRLLRAAPGVNIVNGRKVVR